MLSVSIPSDAPPIEIRLSSGELLTSARNAVGRVLIKSRRVLLDLARNPALGFARAYVEGKIEIEGDLVATLCAVLKSNLAQKGPPLVSRLRRFLLPNSIARARHNTMAHYDLGPEFFKLWLDETMTYSGAVFPREDTPLCQAQQVKCDLICNKLALQPDERFLDIGCGWGYLALHVAEKYGASSLGITNSPGQQRYATQRAAQRGLADRCRFELRDYRQIAGVFDKIASVGMLEHVGRSYLGGYFSAIAAALRPGGRCVIQVIGQQHPKPVTDFANAIFPGGYFPTGAEILHHAAAAGLSWRHADNLSEHYALTLRQWRKNFQAAREKVEALKDRAFARWWELYLAVSEANFTADRLQLFQILFTKGNEKLPLTRNFATF
ncbi:MAG: class I SAM-dependent methyltransferase [Acidobacteria bacterium]|nr:class I SAM-dependent methyltransferase [Acidobacteriota bacterium]